MYRSAMIIDDSKLERFLTERIMANCGFAGQVESFNSGAEGLAHLHSLEGNLEEFPEILFLDIHMPVMSGFDFLEKFLEFSEEIKEHCKIIIISSTDAPEDHARMKTFPIIYKFLPKPLSEKMLDSVRINKKIA